MSSLDLISRGRVRLGQHEPERISKEKLGAAGSTGWQFSRWHPFLWVCPKMLLPGARRMHTCDQSSSRPPGPQGSQAEQQVSSFFPSVNVMAAEPRVGTASSVSIVETSHHAFPLWEIHWAWRWLGPCAPLPAAPHLPNILWRSTEEETQESSPSRMSGPHRSWEAQSQD